MDIGTLVAGVTKQMKPGRELDSLVAEAMGWRHEPRFNGDVGGYWVTPKGRIINEELPAFSTDWEAAGEAWEWLEKQPRPVDASIALSKSINGKPAVLMIGLMANPKWPHIRYEIEGETYPHAIALAVAEAGHKARRGLPVDVNAKP